MRRVPYLAFTPMRRWRYCRILVVVCGSLLTLQFLFFARPSSSSLQDLRSLISPDHSRQTPMSWPGYLEPSKAQQDETNNTASEDAWSPYTEKLFSSHGFHDCLNRIPDDLPTNAQSVRDLCERHAPFDLSAPAPRVGVATAHFGSDDECQDALQTYLLHGLIHSHEVHVLCDEIVDGMWNKPAFLLKVLMEEMMKPESDRLEWILWADGDTILLDQCRPISSFLPLPPTYQPAPTVTKEQPKTTFFSRVASFFRLSDSPQQPDEKDLHLLVTHDRNGLNAGVFLLRVSQVSINLLTAIISHPTHHPKTRLRFSEQTAMDLLLRSATFKPHTQIVPQHWFNSYTYTDRNEKGNNLGYTSTWVEGDIDSGARVFAERTNTTGLEGGFRDGYVRRGDFLVHFAGNVNKEQNVQRWMKMLEEEGIVWKGKGGVQRNVNEEVEAFWRELGY